jgi:hypothetical protein
MAVKQGEKRRREAVDEDDNSDTHDASVGSSTCYDQVSPMKEILSMLQKIEEGQVEQAQQLQKIADDQIKTNAIVQKVLENQKETMSILKLIKSGNRK